MGLRILVVDDLPINLQLLTDILEFRGHQIDAARTVGEGLALLRSAKPDIALLDLQMPDGGGHVLMKEIRADPDLRSIPVVAVTAHAAEHQTALQQGFDGLILKPINTGTFATTVEAFVTRVDSPRTHC